ncbi:MAG: hypothetical protein PHG54_01935 [Smithellaceae bacterium]|nr:hypothetical protein [Smithellaceae bacterium]
MLESAQHFFPFLQLNFQILQLLDIFFQLFIFLLQSNQFRRIFFFRLPNAVSQPFHFPREFSVVVLRPLLIQPKLVLQLGHFLNTGDYRSGGGCPLAVRVFPDKLFQSESGFLVIRLFLLIT